MERGGDGRILALLLPTPKGAVMPRYLEKAEDKAELVVGGTVFAVVAALTAVVMAIGFPIMETIERFRHHA